MSYESAHEAARRLGVTVRAVQKWAKEGKLNGAKKVGRDWLIPDDAVRADKDTAVNEANAAHDGFAFPLFDAVYTPGELEAYVRDIADEGGRAIALSEHYYFTGRLKEATIAAEPYMSSENPAYRLSAATFCVFSNMCRGRMHITNYAADVVRKEVLQTLQRQTYSLQDALGAFSATIIRTQLHIPLGKVPPLRPFMRYMNEGHRIITCYLLAYQAYLDKDYSKSLGIVETAMDCSMADYPLPFIYLHIMAAMNHMNLVQIDEAKASIEKAWALAEPDGLIMPFVEHYSLLLGTVEAHFKKNHPAAYAKIVETVRQYNHGWSGFYTDRTEQTFSGELTPTEFTIAMLYNRGWTAKEIAEHLELSERTIKNYLQIVYEKLGINSKKGLNQYMLK